MQIRKYVILSAIFQLSVLCYPMVTKGLHRHEYHSHHHHCEHESITCQSEQCVICDYEFVKAIVPELIQLTTEFAAFSIHKTTVRPAVFTEVIPYYSLRAPPSV